MVVVGSSLITCFGHYNLGIERFLGVQTGHKLWYACWLAYCEEVLVFWPQFCLFIGTSFSHVLFVDNSPLLMALLVAIAASEV